MSENKQPISNKWRKILSETALIKAVEQDNLDVLFKDFPKDMEIPSDIFDFKNREYDGGNILHVASRRCFLDEFLIFAKEKNINLTPIFNSKNNFGDNFLHTAAKNNVIQIKAVIETSSLDVIGLNNFYKLMEAKNNLGENVYVAAEKEAERDDSGHYSVKVNSVKVTKKILKDIKFLTKKAEIFEKMGKMAKDTETYQNADKSISVDLLKNKQNSR